MQNVNGIASLPTELLGDIFLKNTERDDPNHNRLVTARRSSQVCQLWRAILLASPSVWARLLHLNYFEKAKEIWTQEVIARGAGAALWITGNIISSSTLPLFKSLMKNHWERVQDLEVTDVQEQGSNKTWTFLSREAPILERLDIRSFGRDPIYARRVGPPVIPFLFNNVAPHLQEFCVPQCFWFDPTTPCLSNVRIFDIPENHTVPMILSSLKMMSRLTHLKIAASPHLQHPPVKETDLVKVNLPTLKRLQIWRREFHEARTLLECITPSSHCSLMLVPEVPRVRHYNSPLARPWPCPLTTRDMILIQKWVMPYINGHRPNTLKLQIEQIGRFVLFAISDINLRDSTLVRSVLYVEVVLDAVEALSFVQELIAFSRRLSCAVKRLQVDSLSVLSDWYSVYQDLDSITELTITNLMDYYIPDPDARTWFTRDDITGQPREEALFPRLHTLILDVIFDPNHLEHIVDYLEYRREIGLPVSVLDASRSLYATAPECVRMRDCLDKLDGLVVMWKMAGV
ncbi:hypothetical protein CPC08DRAFT_208427 [Agrocybe pediades]|nr:hypothetical protein CPC08DRAFT_208427 [Agrocybe pediades]